MPVGDSQVDILTTRHLRFDVLFATASGGVTLDTQLHDGTGNRKSTSWSRSNCRTVASPYRVTTLTAEERDAALTRLGAN